MCSPAYKTQRDQRLAPLFRRYQSEIEKSPIMKLSNHSHDVFQPHAAWQCELKLKAALGGDADFAEWIRAQLSPNLGGLAEPGTRRESALMAILVSVGNCRFGLDGKGDRLPS